MLELTVAKQRSNFFSGTNALTLNLLCACLLFATACSHTESVVVQHDVAEGLKPWTEQAVAHDADTVRFAVFSDITGGEREGVFEMAVEQLNLLRPEIIVNVGDLIDGDTDRAELNRQWDSFDGRASKAQARLFYTGGNHDLLNMEMRATWEDRVGPRYYSFRYRDLLFLILDTEDHTIERMKEIAMLREEALTVAAAEGRAAARQTEYAHLAEEETGMISKSQSEYMLKSLADNTDVRWTFLLMHKAPWANEDMPAWKSIEHALEGRDYTVFHGHRHAYKHQQRQGMDYIQLATTGGVFQPEFGPAMDHLLWVTVDEAGAHIANLKLSGILDKTGQLPMNGDERCLEHADCPDE
ncbi:MAG: metallophosphoesterase family protein [Hyphomicrobiales bacterium]